jgi:hypothetical protein
MLRDFTRDVARISRQSRGGLIKLEFSVETPTYSVRSYREKDVETDVVCDQCGLEFAVYGVFATCPDCGQLNAFTIFRRSIDVSRKRLSLATLDESLQDEQLAKAIVSDTLGGAVSAFDALGKALRSRRPDVFPSNPRNLFQNLDALDKCLRAATGRGIPERMGGVEGGQRLRRSLQVRHVLEHNMGVVDDDFVRKLPELRHLHGRLYPLRSEEVSVLLDDLTLLVGSIEEDFDAATGSLGDAQ